LQGTYFFADYCSGQIWSLTYDGNTAIVVERTQELAPRSPLSITDISSFGTDAAGEIYICDRNGEVYKIVPATGVPKLIHTDPPDESIDARTPLARDGTTRLGVNQVTFFFNQATNCAMAGHFVIEQEGSTGAAPQVATVQSVAGNGLQVNLNAPIEPKTWATIMHGPTQSKVRVGYLPGDVNGDGFSGPVDILDLIDALNGIGPVRSMGSTDLDRSGLALPADILMLVDLLNGAGALDAYLGARLP
jgi:hypothetical protein